ncbi:MAG: inositol monophosphatase [Planctomycetota bacterium]|nr:MAG: inositol monophosphatase [Planctomycetota bacterium]REJ94714.1 MAG: inositol monophosphatase [Planctomycetota bacterium]REK31325.1 MAG: inositol monophosphatase [Planctomycetota bacterium]REK39050.1 MAG: inositol monophosphatase [Planctomycetota bacterium]
MRDSHELNVARQAARAGGDVLSRCFGRGASVRSKSASVDLVTDADVDAEKAIVDVIRRACPDHAVLAEESLAETSEAEHLWIVDPLDGTTNYAHGIPHFAVSVAFYRQGVPECGVVWNPIRDDLFEAQRGAGALRNGESVQVASNTQLDEALVGVGFYYDRGAMMEATLAAVADLFRQNIHGIRRFGTASLDLCHVGSGYYGAFFEYELSPWDFAAGRLFVEEAGGKVSTCAGEPLPVEKTHLLATNGALHDSVLEIVRRHLP